MDCETAEGKLAVKKGYGEKYSPKYPST